MNKRLQQALEYSIYGSHADDLERALNEYGVSKDALPEVKKELRRVRREMEDRQDFEVPNVESIKPEKRQQLVQILTHLACNGKTITYQELATQLGLPAAGNALAKCLVPYLSNVFFWCKARKLPHLTSLVVRKSGTDKGVPGPGFWEFLGTGITKTAEKRDLTHIYHKEVYAFFAPL